MTDLEAKLRDMADKGLLSHLSVYAQWGAHKSPTVFHASVITIHGQGHHDSTDIVEAVLTAIEEAPKQARRHTSAVLRSDKSDTGKVERALNPEIPGPQTPAPVASKPIKPVRQQNDRKTPRGQTDIPVPNLMELFK